MSRTPDVFELKNRLTTATSLCISYKLFHRIKILKIVLKRVLWLQLFNMRISLTNEKCSGTSSNVRKAISNCDLPKWSQSGKARGSAFISISRTVNERKRAVFIIHWGQKRSRDQRTTDKEIKHFLTLLLANTHLIFTPERPAMVCSPWRISDKTPLLLLSCWIFRSQKKKYEPAVHSKILFFFFS